MSIEKTVFISYRRVNEAWAISVYQYLSNHNYDVFFDYNSINSGDFEQIILNNIESRAHFILLLTPTALDRCSEPNDWLRREIEYAMDTKRNIVPILLERFSFSAPSTKKQLTGKLAQLPRYNAQDVPQGFFEDAMRKVVNRFLNVDVGAVLHPRTAAAEKAAQRTKAQVTNTTTPATQQHTKIDIEDALAELTEIYYAGNYQEAVDTANRILEHAPDNQAVKEYRTKSEDKLIRGVVSAHRIPLEARVKYNRANSLVRAGKHDEAEKLYREAREIAERQGILSWRDVEQALLDIQDLRLARELMNEGDRLATSGQWKEAVRKYEGALRVMPNYSIAEVRLNNAKKMLQQNT